MDSKLTLMLLLQSIIAAITYFPYASELIYTNVSQYWSKPSLQKAQEKVFVEFIHILSYAFFASSFYVSIISNIGFRRQFKNCFGRGKERETTGIVHTIFRANASVML
jgi:hypothetical protein